MRIKTGFTRRRKHKKILQTTKGYRMTKNRLIRVAKEAQVHAGQYAYIGRRLKRRDLRALWIIRLNAACRHHNISYSQFIKNLKLAKIELDRKILSEIAVKNPEVFESIVKQISS